VPFTLVTKIFRNKFTQGSERSLQWKLWNTDERNYKRHENVKISYVHGLEESILFKMTILPEVIYRFNEIPQILITFFTNIQKKSQNSYEATREPE
jgi:hypothetical protein